MKISRSNFEICKDDLDGVDAGVRVIVLILDLRCDFLIFVAIAVSDTQSKNFLGGKITIVSKGERDKMEGPKCKK